MMRCAAVIPQQHVIAKILGHLRLPITPIPVSGPHTLGFGVLAYEVTDEAIADWFGAPGKAWRFQRVQFPPRQGEEPLHRESSLGLMEVTTWVKRRQSDARDVTKVKR